MLHGVEERANVMGATIPVIKSRQSLPTMQSGTAVAAHDGEQLPTHNSAISYNSRRTAIIEANVSMAMVLTSD
jgi:hypothetical protein